MGKRFEFAKENAEKRAAQSETISTIMTSISTLEIIEAKNTDRETFSAEAGKSIMKAHNATQDSGRRFGYG